MDWFFDGDHFTLYCLAAEGFIDFSEVDIYNGLTTTHDPRKSKIYLKMKGPGGYSNPVDKFKNFLIGDSPERDANHLIGVDDGQYPSVWLEPESPYGADANMDNFLWGLDVY